MALRTDERGFTDAGDQGAAMARKDFQFFLNNAGYATPPGRAVCALHLAKAEAEARRLGFTAEWVEDSDADWSWMDEAEREKDHEVYGCILNDAAGNHIASLWGIFDPDRNYRRVVQAELALEAIS